MMTWILAHWEDILASYGFIVGLCTTIVKMTPSVSDDVILGKVLRVLDFFSTAFLKSDAEKLNK